MRKGARVFFRLVLMVLLVLGMAFAGAGASQAALLADLTLSSTEGSVALLPAGPFDPATGFYNAYAADSVTGVTLTLKAGQDDAIAARCTFAGGSDGPVNIAADGTGVLTVSNIVEGLNTVKLTIEKDGDASVKKEYTIAIYRATAAVVGDGDLVAFLGLEYAPTEKIDLTPAFAPKTLSYAATVSNTTAGVNVLLAAINSSYVTIHVNGMLAHDKIVLPPNMLSPFPVTLGAGTNTIKVLVEQEGIPQEGGQALSVGYTITITRPGGTPDPVDPEPTTIPISGFIVSPDVLSLDLTGRSADKVVGIVTPSNATNRWVTWSMDKTGIVELSATGSYAGTPITAKAKSAGVVTITGSIGSFKDTCVVTVTDDTLSVVVSPDKGAGETGKPFEFTAIAKNGKPPYTYQWSKGGALLVGATGATYKIDSVAAASAGTYTCVVQDSLGAKASASGTLEISRVTITAAHVGYTACELEVTVRDSNGNPVKGCVVVVVVANVDGEKYNRPSNKTTKTDGTCRVTFDEMAEATKYVATVDTPYGSASVQFTTGDESDVDSSPNPCASFVRDSSGRGGGIGKAALITAVLGYAALGLRKRRVPA